MGDKNNLIIDRTDKLVNHTKDLFSYLNEPYDKSADILVKAFMDNKMIGKDDIDLVTANLLARKWVRKIRNCKSIMKKANNQFNFLLKNYDDELKNNIKPQKPDDEWLDYFLDLASLVQEEVVQDLWANLLMREHLAPGQISKVMLNKLALLDSKSAQAFSKLCKLTYELKLEDEIIKIPLIIYEHDINENVIENEYTQNVMNEYFEYCPNDEELEVLEEIGLIKMNLRDREYYMYFSENIDVNFRCKKSSTTIKGKYDKEGPVYTVTTGYVFFTQIGLSLYNIIEKSQGEYENLGIVLKGFADSQANT